jgi:hypothetical protein
MGNEVQRLPVINYRASINDPTLTIEEILNSMAKDVELLSQRIKNLQEPEYTKTWDKHYLFTIEQDVTGLGFGIQNLQEMLSDE